jgi:hypothetical protein
VPCAELAGRGAWQTEAEEDEKEEKSLCKKCEVEAPPGNYGYCKNCRPADATFRPWGDIAHELLVKQHPDLAVKKLHDLTRSVGAAHHTRGLSR